MDNKRCPICGKEFEDILRHFVLEHDIKDMEQLKQISDGAEKKEDLKKAFSDYVEKLKRKLKTREISPEDYRELSMKWCRDHQTEG